MKELKCIHIYKSIRIDNNGQVCNCCIQQQRFKTKEGNPINCKDSTFNEILNTPTAIEIRESFLNGEKHESCKYCWLEEDSGKESKRQRDLKTWPLLNNKDLKVQFLDINMGNICNIKCRTCGPYNSTSWFKEVFEIEYFKQMYHHVQKIDIHDEDSKLWIEIEKCLPNLLHIDFYGGEPLLVDKQWEILQIAIKKNVAKNISIHYNTNGTIWDKSKTDILKHFKFVQIDFSIDGIDSQNYYIRYPAKWENVLKNFKILTKLSKELTNFKISCCITVSSLNIFYINSIIEYIQKININIYLNLVHQPLPYCITNIPENIKKEITKKPLLSDDNFFYRKWFEDVINFMNYKKCNEDDWLEFLKVTKILDESRKQDFKITFPEFYKIINDSGYTI